MLLFIVRKLITLALQRTYDHLRWLGLSKLLQKKFFKLSFGCFGVKFDIILLLKRIFTPNVVILDKIKRSFRILNKNLKNIIYFQKLISVSQNCQFWAFWQLSSPIKT